MFNETEVLMQLEGLLGKEFTLPNLCDSYGYNTAEFAEYFFELEKENKISFVINSKGSLRLSNVLDKNVQIEQVENEAYTFPKDVATYNLIVFGLTLKPSLRIQFDKCMAENLFVEKFKKMEESEIIKFLEIRRDVLKKETKELMEKHRLDAKKTSAFNKDAREFKKKSGKLTDEERKKISEAQKAASPIKKSKKDQVNFELEKEKKLNSERRANRSRSGYFETNQERFERIALELKQKNLNKKSAFKERIDERKGNVHLYSLGQIVEGKVLKIIEKGMYVDIGKSDGFVHISELKSPRSLKFLRQMQVGKTLNFEIIDIDFTRRNIDLIPTSKKIMKGSNIEAIKKQKLLVEDILQELNDNKVKDSLKFLVRLIKKCLKYNSSEWALVPSKSRLKKIRLINSEIVICVVDRENVTLTVMYHPNDKNVELNKLIDEYVPPKKRQGFFPKMPTAVPLVLPHKVAMKNKRVLYSAFLQSFERSQELGKNPMKSSHSVYLVDKISELFSENLEQPAYIK